MGFRGGGQIDPPPQRILVFKYPSGDRVKTICKKAIFMQIEIANWKPVFIKLKIE